MGSYVGSSEGSVNKLLQQIGCLVMVYLVLRTVE